jgi:DNA-binding winged helix-turn-helix (wHTH) protein/TolB-like protein
MDGPDPGMLYEFGSFRADTLKRRLYRDGDAVALSAKGFDILLTLVRNPGETVSRDALIDAIWAGTSVEDNNLTQQISFLRKTLGESPGEHKFILTVPGKGYSFVTPVRRSVCYEGTERPVKNLRRGMFSWLSLLPDSPRITGYLVAIGYILIVCLPFFYSGVRNALSDGPPQSLAVLQFRTNRGDEFIGNGISETLRARLGSVADLTVRSSPPSLTDLDVVTAGRELKVDAVVTGSVQRAEGRIRITVEMVDVVDGRIIWGRTFDDEPGNIFALQDSIAGEVAGALRVRLTSLIPRGISLDECRICAS